MTQACRSLSAHSVFCPKSFSPFYNQNRYLDLEDIHHITHNPSNLMDFISLPGYDQVHIENGQSLCIISLGSMIFLSNVCRGKSLTLNKLLFVPSIIKSIVIVSQFAWDKDVFFEFHVDSCYVKCCATSKVLLSGFLRSDGLYKFDG